MANHFVGAGVVLGLFRNDLPVPPKSRGGPAVANSWDVKGIDTGMDTQEELADLQSRFSALVTRFWFSPAYSTSTGAAATSTSAPPHKILAWREWKHVLALMAGALAKLA